MNTDEWRKAYVAQKLRRQQHVNMHITCKGSPKAFSQCYRATPKAGSESCLKAGSLSPGCNVVVAKKSMNYEAARWVPRKETLAAKQAPNSGSTF